MFIFAFGIAESFERAHEKFLAQFFYGNCPFVRSVAHQPDVSLSWNSSVLVIASSYSLHVSTRQALINWPLCWLPIIISMNTLAERRGKDQRSEKGKLSAWTFWHRLESEHPDPINAQWINFTFNWMLLITISQLPIKCTFVIVRKIANAITA